MDSLIPIARDIGAALSRRGETVGVSESSAGGLVSAALLAVPGASTWYRGGGVIYTPQAFRGLLQLTRGDIEGMRSATEPYARVIAGTIRARLRADWGLCETWASGPNGNPYGDAAGHCCVGIAGPDGQTSGTLETGETDRLKNMLSFAEYALHLLEEAVR
jgi:PncC family amidohydrolase